MLAWQKLLSIALISGFGLGCGIGAVWYVRTHTDIKPNLNSAVVAPTPSPTPDPLAPVSVALLGYGGGSHAGGSLTDSILIVKIKPKLKQILLLSIPRDLWVTVPHLETAGKINAAYSLGFDERRWPLTNRPEPYQTKKTAGGMLARETFSGLLGWPVQYSAAVSFSGFEQALGALGPITVNVPQSFTDEFYPLPDKETDPCEKSEADIAALTATLSGFLLEKQFTCRYETLSFEKGPVTMDAITALKFVRSRHSDVAGNDFNRSLRQQALIQAVRQKLFQPSVWLKIPALAAQILKLVDTNLTIGTLTTWLTTFPEPTTYQVKSMNLSLENTLVASKSADGQFILVPKPELGWAGLQQFVSDWENQQATFSSPASKSAVQSTP
jgi:anionic cell wall polymer biosynthesis LytR-Cps2A-Psr (LCP) family protein